MVSFLKVSDLSVEYSLENNRVFALDNITLDIPTEGYTLGLVGESGSGKTTLGLSLMRNIEAPGRITSGTIEYMGTNVMNLDQKQLRKYRWQEVSMVYQSAMNSLNPVKRACDHISEVLTEHTRISKREAHERALKLLSEVGIKKDRAKDYPHELSGGMRQRVVIALALALSPKLLIADEPTSALDVVTQRQILTLVRNEVKKKGLSLIFITHEISLLSNLVDNVAVTYSGEIVEVGPAEKVLSNPLHPYTEMLINTLLTLDSGLRSNLTRLNHVKESEKPLLANACKYANRCIYAFQRCREERPTLRENEKERWTACHKYS